MNRVRCDGWWEQSWFGRQTMRELEIIFDGGRLRGTGTDIIGPFQLEGICAHDRVTIYKQYIGKHHVDYYGTSDGEGTFHGYWRCSGLVGGKWLIRIGRFESIEGDEVCDITESFVSESRCS